MLTGPSFRGSLLKSGRTFGANYTIFGHHPDFRASTGLISRPAIVDASATHSYTVYGGTASTLERASLDPRLIGTWQFRDFTGGREPLEKKAHLNSNFQLRGGWQFGASILVEEFRFDESLYQGYRIERNTGGVIDTVPFTGTPSLPNLDWVLTFNTPQWKPLVVRGVLRLGQGREFLRMVERQHRVRHPLPPTGARPTGCGSTPATTGSTTTGAPTAAPSVRAGSRG